VFIHLIISMLISRHYKWKRFMGYSKWHNISYETISLHLKLYCLFKWPASIKLSYQALNYLSGQIIILHHLGNLYTPMLVQLWASLPIPIIYIYHMKFHNCGIKGLDWFLVIITSLLHLGHWNSNLWQLGFNIGDWKI
jgi:hypothetical protein